MIWEAGVGKMIADFKGKKGIQAKSMTVSGNERLKKNDLALEFSE